MSKPYSQTGENPTGTNQASEDELRAEIAQYLESTYQDGAVMATRPNSGYHKRVDEFTDKLLALIRTEKLKLLAEVRRLQKSYLSELTSNDDDADYDDFIATHSAALTKLEAEL